MATYFLSLSPCIWSRCGKGTQELNFPPGLVLITVHAYFPYPSILGRQDYSTKYMYIYIHCTTIHNLGNNPNVHQWMHGFHKPWQIVAYEILYYGILFHCRKMKSWYNVSEFWKHAKWKKPEAKGHIWNDSISMKYSEYVNPETGCTLVVTMDRWRGIRE